MITRTETPATIANFSVNEAPQVNYISFFYQSGQEIRPRDRVLIHGETGEIEFIADPAENPDDWYVKEYGGGIMVLELKVFGRIFVTEPESDEHLTFVSRQSGP